MKYENTEIRKIAQANYMYKVFRMITMFRGSTASLIYSKSLRADEHHNHMAAVTLMSTDVDRIGISYSFPTCDKYGLTSPRV